MASTPTETRDVSRSSSHGELTGEGRSVLFNPGDVLAERYEVIRQVGQGGMGRVLEVRCLESGQHVALKYCDPARSEAKRLVREARILGGITHSHLIPILDAHLDHEPPFFVMPLARETLSTAIRRYRGDWSWAFATFRQICLGVQALHHAGVIHRDLKPSNVLRLADGRYVVADLGTAKREPRDSSILTQTCAIVGTFSYLAPEQLMPGGSRQADARTDVYQLGKMLYQMTTGKYPAVIDPAVPHPALAHLILRATAPDPANRYAEVWQLIEAIETCPWSDRLETASLSQVFDEALSRIKRLGHGHPRFGELCDELLSVLASLHAQPALETIELFDRVPDGVLAFAARDRPGRFLAPLRAFADALMQAASRKNFRYADQVAARMTQVYKASTDILVKTAAAQAILVVAVALNRYAAMNALRKLLYEIRDPVLGLSIADMLIDHRDDFQEIAPRLHDDRLHPILRQLVNEMTWSDTISF